MTKKISGFPELLPEERMIERHFIDTLSTVAESYGYCSIDTRAVERVSDLKSQSNAAKEIYKLSRLVDQEAAGDEPESLGLRFDLTIPLARYVSENFHSLCFPFKRYQIGKVWRGERAQEGRYREFYQADFDVISRGGKNLYGYDSELIELVFDAFDRLPVPAIVIRINNRKLLQGIYEAVGIVNFDDALRIVDKLPKIGRLSVLSQLKQECQLNDEQVTAAVGLADIKSDELKFVDAVRALGYSNKLVDEGLGELATTLEHLRPVAGRRLIVDLGIVRGLSYYTGIIVEGFLQDNERLGAVCSGGRYDNLVSSFDRREQMPGVGMSIGLSRLIGYLVKHNRIRVNRKCNTDLLICLPSEDARLQANKTARVFRRRGIRCEVYHSPDKYGKQIEYADRKGIRHVWFIPDEQDKTDEVRDIVNGLQVAASPDSWQLPLSLEPGVQFLG